MTVAQFSKDTLIWVWIWLVFLIKRGSTAISDPEMRIERLFLLPRMLAVGIGWMLWRSQPRLRAG